MQCCAIVFLDADVSFAPAGRRWELDPWRRTTLGRARAFSPTDATPYPHLPLGAAGPGRLHSSVRRIDDGWWMDDLRSAGGTFVNGQRLRGPTAIADGDRLDIPTHARFERFERRRLLEHPIAVGPWTLFGRDRTLGPGHWPALGLDGGRIVRATALVRSPSRPLEPPILPDAREVIGPFVVDIYPGVEGVPLSAFPELARLDRGIALKVLSAIPVTSGVEVLVDFDGGVHAIPGMRHADDLALLRVGNTMDGPPAAAHELAATMRGLFGDAWALERDLRDELAVLTPDAMQRWRDAAAPAQGR